MCVCVRARVCVLPFRIFENEIFKFNFHSKIHLYEKNILKQNDMESLSKIMLLPYFISFRPNLN